MFLPHFWRFYPFWGVNISFTKKVKNESCLDFSDGHFKLLHMKICSKIKKLRILGFKWRIDVRPMSIWRQSNFCLDYSITTIIPNTRLYFCVNNHAELILVLSIKVIIDHTGDKHASCIDLRLQYLPPWRPWSSDQLD